VDLRQIRVSDDDFGLMTPLPESAADAELAALVDDRPTT